MRQTALNTVLIYLGIGLGFVNVVLLYPRVLAAEEFGLTRLLVSMAAIGGQLAQLGVENTVIRYFPYFQDQQRRHRGILGLLLLFGTGTGLLAMLVILLFHERLALAFSDTNALYAEHGLLLVPLVLAEVFFILLRSYSRSLGRTVQPVFIREFMLRALQTLLIAMQAWKPQPFDRFMLLYTAIFLACTVALAFDLSLARQMRAGWKYLWWPRRLRRSMLWYSSFTFSASLAGIVLGNMDQLMIGALLDDGLRYVAYYAVAFYFGSVIAAPGRALNHAAVPLLAKAWKERDTVRIAQLYRRSAQAQLVAGGFFFVVMWTSIDDLFTLLPADYGGGVSVALIVGVAYLLNGAIGLGTGIISMSRSYRVDAWSSLSLLVINLLANFFLIRSLGMVGAAWATLLSLVLVNAYRVVFLRKRYGLWPFGASTAKAVLVIAATGLMGLWVPFTGIPLWDLLLRGALVTLVFGAMAHGFGLLPELRALLQREGSGRK